ncbi:MAG: conjugal transfer protein TraF [Elusimicrobiota bacterium]
MKLKRALAPLLTGALFAASAAQALEWQTLGAQAMGMGGTGVALAKGPLGAYWNPAGLAQPENPSGTATGIGAEALVAGSLLQGANSLNNLYTPCNNFAKSLNNGVFDFADLSVCNLTNINNALNEFGGPGNGVSLNIPAALFDLKVGNFTLFANSFNYLGLSPSVDTVDEAIPIPLPGSTAQPPNSILNNISGLTFNALSVEELGIGYAHELPSVAGLYLGGNLKALVGATAFDQIYAEQTTNGNFPTPDSGNYNVDKQLKPAVDLGFLWDVDKTFSQAPFNPRLGLTMRNINNPKFANPARSQGPVCANGVPFSAQPANCVLFAQPSQLAVGAQTRFGVALSPLHFINLTADVDLNKNPTLVNGYSSQMAGAGVELNIFHLTWLNIPLRAGIKRNIAMAGSPDIITGGFGLNFLHLTLDAAAEVTPSLQTISYQTNNNQTTNTASIPSEVGLSFQLGFQFGGGEELTKQQKAEIERFKQAEALAAIRPDWMETAKTDLSEDAAWANLKKAAAEELGLSVATEEKDNFTTAWTDVPSAEMAKPELAGISDRYRYGQVRLKFLQDKKAPFSAYVMIEGRARLLPEKRGVLAGPETAAEEKADNRIGGKQGIVLRDVIPFNVSQSRYERRVLAVLYDALTAKTPAAAATPKAAPAPAPAPAPAAQTPPVSPQTKVKDATSPTEGKK